MEAGIKDTKSLSILELNVADQGSGVVRVAIPKYVFILLFLFFIFILLFINIIIIVLY